MKKTIVSLIAAGLVLSAFTNNAHPQTNVKDPRFNKMEFAIPNDETSGSEKLATVNSKALKDFSKNFKGISSAEWFATKDGSVARFTENGVLNRISYDKKGHWFATTRYYGEKLLPRDVRHIVKSSYYDYKINQVIEITLGENTAYLVQMEDEKSFLTVRVQDGNMDVWSSIQKAN